MKTIENKKVFCFLYSNRPRLKHGVPVLYMSVRNGRSGSPMASYADLSSTLRADDKPVEADLKPTSASNSTYSV